MCVRARAMDERLEAPGVDVRRCDLEHVAAGRIDEAVDAERLSEVRDVALQRVARRLRWIVAPDLVDQRGGGDRPVRPGEKARDSERELRLKAQVGAELPFEEDMGRWFPLWEIPL